MPVNALRALIGLFLALAAPAACGQEIHVAAAANLEQVFTQVLIPRFTHQSGIKVVVTFGATGQLAAQIQNGLPADVFVAADTATIDRLARSGDIVPASRRVYAIGRLVLWSRRDAHHHPRRLQDLADPVYAVIAIANPALAPYGLAAEQSLTRAGLLGSVGKRLVRAENIAQAIQYARSGNADVALTALSLVIADKTDPYVIVPDALHAPIAQGLGLVKSAPQPVAGRRFIDFLTGSDAKPIWARYGYTVPARTGKG